MDQRVRRDFFFFFSLSSWRLEKVEEGERKAKGEGEINRGSLRR